jgi:hypothetical protein
MMKSSNPTKVSQATQFQGNPSRFESLNGCIER